MAIEPNETDKITVRLVMEGTEEETYLSEPEGPVMVVKTTIQKLGFNYDDDCRAIGAHYLITYYMEGTPL